MTEANESLNIRDFLASIQFPFHEYINDKNEGTDECLSDRPGTSHISAVNAGNPNVEFPNLQELDEILPDQVGILHSSDLSTDDLSVSDESEEDVSECSSVGTELSDSLSDINSDISDTPEYCGIDLKDFTGDPKLLKSALAVNRKLQKKLSEGLEKIQNTLNEKEAQMKELQKVKDEISKKGLREPMLNTKATFLSPYFADPGPIGMYPPSNEDTIAKLRNNEITAHQHPSKIWTPYEKSRLLDAVYAVALDYVLKPHNRRLDFVKEKIASQRKNGTLIKYQELEMKEEILRIKYTIKQICAKTNKEIIKEAGDNIDWMRISAQFFQGRRSEEDCEFMWNNFRSIFINKKPFSPAEDRKLKKLVKKYHERNWDLIAEELQTGRTALRCCTRYQRHLNRNIEKKGNFTLEESAKLLRVIEEVRVGDFIPWQKVQQYIDGRKSGQVAKHYELVVKETLDRSPFTKEEDALILACAKKLGAKNWTKIQKYLPHRTYVTIEDRYARYLNPKMKIGAWSDEENFLLIKLVKKYSYGRWIDIAKHLPGRSNIAIRYQIDRLIIKDKNTNEMRFKNPDEIREMSKRYPTSCLAVSERKTKFIIDSAYEALKSALEKIYYHLKKPITLENLSSISFPGLRMLQKELLRRRRKSIRWNINMNWKTRIPNMEPDIYNNANISNSEDDAETNLKESNEIESNWANPKIIIKNSYINSKEKEMEEDEKVFLLKVLDSLCEEEADREYIPPVLKILAELDLGSTVEYSLYEEYLRQQMTCSKTASNGVDDAMCILNERNYKTSLPEVIHHFVHPRASEDQVLVLPPNCASLNAMNNILASDSKLRQTADLVDHSIPYLRYLINLTEKKPKCVNCSQAENAETSDKDYKTALETMKSCLIVPTLEMKKSAMIETMLPALQFQECCCDQLLRSKATVDLLSKRFIALFLWPYFLQSIEPRKEQTKLYQRAYYYYKSKKGNCKKNSRRSKRKCESVDEGCSKKKRPRKDSEIKEAEEDSEGSSWSSSPIVQGSESQSQAAQNEIEVICLSDTPENFCYVEPME